MASVKKTTRSAIPVRKPVAKKSPVGARVPPAAKPKAAVGAARVVPPQAVPKVDKPRKPKLVRDSFTIPKSEFTVLQDLKQRCAKGGAAVKKSEILRAGIKALAAMNDSALAAALAAVPLIKTGRPAKV
jgi:hypothetical protein